MICLCSRSVVGPWCSRWRWTNSKKNYNVHTHRRWLFALIQAKCSSCTHQFRQHTHFVCMKTKIFKDEWIHTRVWRWRNGWCTVELKWEKSIRQKTPATNNKSKTFRAFFLRLLLRRQAYTHRHTHAWARAREKNTRAHRKNPLISFRSDCESFLSCWYSVFFLAMFSPHSCSVCVCACVCAAFESYCCCHFCFSLLFDLSMASFASFSCLASVFCMRMRIFTRARDRVPYAFRDFLCDFSLECCLWKWTL